MATSLTQADLETLRQNIREDFRQELTDQAKHFNTAVNNSSRELEDLITAKAEESKAQHQVILEAIEGLHGERIRHTQEAIVELAKRAGASDLDTVRRVAADLG